MIDKKKLPMQITMGRIWLTIPIMAALYFNTWAWNLAAV